MPSIWDTKYVPAGKVRHAIDWSGWSGTVNLPDSLKLFFDYLYEAEKRRISFVVQNGTVYRKSFTLEIFSEDPQIQQFNDIWFKANQHIPNSKASVRTYDFDTGGVNPNLPDSLDKFLKEIKEIIIIGLVVFIAWKIFGDDILGRRK